MLPPVSFLKQLRLDPKFECTVEGWEDGERVVNVVDVMDRWVTQAADALTVCFNDTVRIRIEQDPHSSHLGGYIWESCMVLCLVLDACAKYQDSMMNGKGSSKRMKCSSKTAPLEVRGRHFCEVGAGVGLVGLMLGKLGAQPAVMTDLDVLVSVMQHNIDVNKDHLFGPQFEHIIEADRPVVARALTWGNAEQVQSYLTNHGYPDTVVACDCIYSEASADALADTLRILTRHKVQADVSSTGYRSCDVLVVSEQRNWSAQEAFLNCVREDFHISIMEPQEWHPFVPSPLRVDYIRFYILSRRVSPADQKEHATD